MSPARRKYACSEGAWRSTVRVFSAADSAWPSTWPPNTYLVPMSRLWPRNRLSSRRSSDSRSISSETGEGIRESYRKPFQRHRGEHRVPRESWAGIALAPHPPRRVVAGRDVVGVEVLVAGDRAQRRQSRAEVPQPFAERLDLLRGVCLVHRL